jgi:hypothetical protein
MEKPMTKRAKREQAGEIGNALLDLVSGIPESTQKPAADSYNRARRLTTTAALKAAGMSGLLALPPGPLGLLTILPDLVAFWRSQAQLVSDIAAVYGKTAYVTQQSMLSCLFRHAAAQGLRDVAIRVGQRVVIRRPSSGLSQALLRRVGLVIGQRVLGKGVARFIPFIGAAGVASYAYFDTRQVGHAAIEMFSRNISLLSIAPWCRGGVLNEAVDFRVFTMATPPGEDRW